MQMDDNAALKEGHLGARPDQSMNAERSLITSHNSSSTEATADRRWSLVADNLDRFVHGEKLESIVLQT